MSSPTSVVITRTGPAVRGRLVREARAVAWIAEGIHDLCRCRMAPCVPLPRRVTRGMGLQESARLRQCPGCWGTAGSEPRPVPLVP